MRFLPVVLLLISCGGGLDPVVIETIPSAEVDWLMVTEGRDILALVGDMKESGVSFTEAFSGTFQTEDANVATIYDHLMERPGVEVTSGTPQVADDGSRIMIPWMWSGLDTRTDEFYTVVGASIFVIEEGAIVDEMAIYDPGPWLTPPAPFSFPGG